MYGLLFVGGLLTALAFLIILIFLMKITVTIDYFHQNKDDRLSIVVKTAAGMWWRKYEFPVLITDDDETAIMFQVNREDSFMEENTKGKVEFEDVWKIIHDLKEILQHIIGFERIVRNFMKKVIVRKLSWHTKAGIGDAAATAVIFGIIWGAKGSTVGLMSKYAKIRCKPELSVTPCFQAPFSQTELSCIIQVRIGHAIFAGTRIVKYWKGGFPEPKSRPLQFYLKKNQSMHIEGGKYKWPIIQSRV
ncbi:DUF2953 domain-containing protein [Bacillus massilinigeriensis]|uniref:DUF2953 domain-containing protein n=1 Tax=Bacillus mediterraneensis TaxID=1805474 RepID=UPI0009F23641|nr:DUF2953 domain-containing protein [Bacillus mediterraneensis]